MPPDALLRSCVLLVLPLSGCVLVSGFLFSPCGDGITQPDEACDDGNTISGDGCSVFCAFEGCGDGILDAGEACDDGNASNGDGCQRSCTLPLQIAVASESSGSVSFFQSDGAQTFTPLQTIPTNGTASNLAIADFNEDGLQDLLVPDLSASSLSLLLGLGGGAFSAPVTLATNEGPLALAVLDLNQDDHLDIVCAHFGQQTPGSSLAVFFGDGTGSFSRQPDITVGERPNFLVLVDQDRDKAPDQLWLNNRDDELVSIFALQNNGTLTLLANLSTDTDPLVQELPESFVVADLNNDGVLDLASANNAAARVFVLLLDGALAPLSSQTIDVAAQPTSISALDLDQDSSLDLLVYHLGASQLSLLPNQGGVVGAPSSFATPGGGLAHLVADLNDDGALDLITTNINSATQDNTISIFFFEQGQFVLKENLPAGVGPRFVVVGQFF